MMTKPNLLTLSTCPDTFVNSQTKRERKIHALTFNFVKSEGQKPVASPVLADGTNGLSSCSGGSDG
jgi:hypothetical protein